MLAPSESKTRNRHAILGNVGTIISFRGRPYLAREFNEVFDESNLVQLPNHHVYMKLMIDGMQSIPFSAITVRP